MISATESLKRLRDGNQRYVEGSSQRVQYTGQIQREKLVSGQNPFAVILGCSDSRVPAELVFDQGLGDLFVIRVAGNIVAPSQVGSVEFAVEAFGTQLVVVMGHTQCGAVSATLNQLMHPQKEQSPNLNSIVDRIRPSVESLMETDLREDPAAMMKHAVRLNIRASVDHLRHGSRILEDMVASRGLKIVGAEYSLESGAVEFFEDS